MNPPDLVEDDEYADNEPGIIHDIQSPTDRLLNRTPTIEISEENLNNNANNLPVDDNSTVLPVNVQPNNENNTESTNQDENVTRTGDNMPNLNQV